MTTTRLSERPLDGLSIAISISPAEPELLAERGLTSADVNDVAVELCRRMVSMGAMVLLGHQWTPGGVMDAVARFAQVYQTEIERPIIHSYLAPPDRAALSSQDRERLQNLVVIHEDGDAADISRRDALTIMRKRMLRAADACVCLSGKVVSGDGGVPGVLEEAAISLSLQRPLYPSGFLGGASDLLMRFVAGERETLVGESQSPDGRQFKSPRRAWVGPYLDTFAETNAARAAERCGLTDYEFSRLAAAQNVDTLVHLVSKGLVARRRMG